MQPIEEPALTPDLIAARYQDLLRRLRAAAEGAGRDPDAFRVVAVTKGFGVPVVRAAQTAGLTRFGENRLQEALPKLEAVPGAEWHFIGRLQSNKARRAVERFGVIHSVDSLDLLRRIERMAHDIGRSTRLLLQVNVTAEPAKAGFDPAWLAGLGTDDDLVTTLGELRAARVVGLMTMGRAGASAAEQRAVFGSLRRLRDRLAQATGLSLPELSMGMTADAAAAVAEGATLVRVGTAIFGPRPA